MAHDPDNELPGLRAVAHPLRLTLLSLLTGQSMSAAEAARHLGETQANVSYHLRRLAASGLITMVEETTVNGGQAKKYRHLPESGEVLQAGGLDDHTTLMNLLASTLRKRSLSYLPDSDHAFTDAEVNVGPDDWLRIQRAARELGSLIHDSALPLEDPRGLRIATTIAVFRLSEDRPAPSP